MRDDLTGPCPVCGGSYPLALNGAVKKHAPRDGAELCAGSGQKPKETGR